MNCAADCRPARPERSGNFRRFCEPKRGNPAALNRISPSANLKIWADLIVWPHATCSGPINHSVMNFPAIYVGLQPGFRCVPAIELYTLLAPVGDHPVGSTVSRQTLEKHGFNLTPGRPAGPSSPRTAPVASDDSSGVLTLVQ